MASLEELDDEEDRVPIAELGLPQAAPDGRQFTVLIDREEEGGATPDPTYPAGIFEIPSEEGEDPTLVAIIAVADLEGRLLVAVPHSCWHRTTAKRVLPGRALAKAVTVEVPFVDRSDDRHDPGKAKIWIGFLAPEFEEAINFETPLEHTILDHNFIRGNVFCLPVATELVDIALQQHPFETAASGVEVAGGQNLDQRLQKLEKSVSLIAESLKKLTPERSPAVTVPKRPSALKATAKATSAPCPPPGLAPTMGGGLDPEVLKSAREQEYPKLTLLRWRHWLQKVAPSFQMSQ